MDVKDINQLIGSINDPGIPALTIKELGILRDIQVNGTEARVTITPTYTGCPALRLIEDQITRRLKEAGYATVEINTEYNPPWSTSDIDPEAYQKLTECGIAPPKNLERAESVKTHVIKSVNCPFCDSKKTGPSIQLGSTPCMAVYKCDSCGENFEHMKWI